MIPFIQPIWLGIHHLAARNLFYKNWKETRYDEDKAATINAKQSKWNSVGVEEKLNYMCIYNIEMNECAQPFEFCNGNGNCTDTFGSFTCQCHDGFETKDEGRTCTNIDECSADFVGGNDCGPNTVGVDNVEPGHTCKCPPGFFGTPYDKTVGCKGMF